MKKAIITSISPGYMFAMHANLATNAFFKTNAEVHMIYSHMEGEEDYMVACHKTFPFKIKWINMPDLDTRCFHNSKYKYAASLAGEYDVVCLIDADLFIIANLDPYFEIAYSDKKLVTAQHLWSGGHIDHLNFADWTKVTDRVHAQMADFPVFIDPNHYKQMLLDWYEFTLTDPSKEISHPLVAFNRSICKNLKADDLFVLDGEQWVCDKNYWTTQYNWRREFDQMIATDEDLKIRKINGIHNKWWKLGRANGEWLAHRHYTENDPDMFARLQRGEHNFNEIKDMMAHFNDMYPATRRDDYLKERISRKEYLATV